MSDLLNMYLRDIEARKAASIGPHAKECFILAKPITNDTIYEEINKISATTK